ncbi:MAG: hypothetical protein IPK13_09550 [Deltaproteobacteria bacterium]|nr:hypothetical protein [Deltaproteobacteria bacterium]
MSAVEIERLLHRILTAQHTREPVLLSRLVTDVQAGLRSLPRPDLPERCRDYLALAATILERGLVCEAEAVVAAVRQFVRQARGHRPLDMGDSPFPKRFDPKNAQARFNAFLGGEPHALGVRVDAATARAEVHRDASRNRNVSARAGLTPFRIRATLRG